MKTFETIGVATTETRAATATGTALEKAISAGPAGGETRLTRFQKARLRANKGWMIDLQGGSYRDSTLRRAFVSKVGWGENIPEEAIYPFTTVDIDNKPLNGTNKYVLHFDADELPPVKAFWSLTLYGPDHFFTANAINRYAIGDRTEGLTYNADGSLDLLIQHEDPSSEALGEYTSAAKNWLPAPDGQFNLMLRFYLPEKSVIDGTYRVPPVQLRNG